MGLCHYTASFQSETFDCHVAQDYQQLNISMASALSVVGVMCCVTCNVVGDLYPVLMRVLCLLAGVCCSLPGVMGCGNGALYPVVAGWSSEDVCFCNWVHSLPLYEHVLASLCCLHKTNHCSIDIYLLPICTRVCSTEMTLVSV